jgi:hypothetical protein
MKLYKAVVKNKQDPKNSAIITCDMLGHSDLVDIPVNYVSPSYDPHNGGFFALPSYATEVLVYYDEDLRQYYYIGTVVANPESLPGIHDANKNDVVNSKNVYTPDGIPKATTFTNSDGAGLKISDYLTDETEQIQSKVQITSNQGHRVKLSDNPNMDAVFIKNKDGDGITISANRNLGELSDNSISINTKNSIRTAAERGQISMTLYDGRDITIENTSSGKNGTPINPGGNINIKSLWKDINIFSQGITNPWNGPAGRVLISTREGLIQIKSGGPITIYSFTDDINVVAQTGNINLKAEGEINLDAGTAINLRTGAGASVQLANGQASVAGAAGTNLGVIGTPLNLNSSITPQPVDLTTVGIPVVGTELN